MVDPLPYGAACADGCEPLLCLDLPNFPGGYCTASCTNDCPGVGGECVAEIGGGLCLQLCPNGNECRDGYQCWRGTCRPACMDAASCGGEGTACDDGVCTGAECTLASDCAGGAMCVGGQCVLVPMDAGVDAAPLDVGSSCDSCDGVCRDGECIPSCVDRTSCGSTRLVCAPIPVDDNDDGAVDRLAGGCIPSDPTLPFLANRCTSDDGCETGTCHEGQCTEVCDDDGDCLIGHTCRPVFRGGLPFSACWYADPATTIDEYTLLERSATGGSAFPRTSFAVPPDAISVSFVVEQSSAPGLAIAFFEVFDPSSESIFDLGGIAELEDQTIRWIPGASSEAITMLVPNTDRYALQSGRYSVLSGAFPSEGTRDVTMRALVRRSVDGGGGGTLRARIHISTGLGFNAANAASSGRLAQTIQRVNQIYAASGVTLVADSYVDIASGAFSVIDSTEGPTSELARLFRTSTPTSDQVVNIFLVRGFGTDNGTLGVAGGIPGPVGVHGAAESGVVVTFDTSIVGNNGTFAGQILAHELGHFLGLYHNRERESTAFGGLDPINDTGSQNSNLMFFAVQRIGGGLNDQITAGQAGVLGRSATVR